MFALKKIMTAAALTFAALGAQAATLTFSAPTVTNGSSVSVDVIASEFPDLYGYQMSISFDQTLLHFTSMVEGNYFGTVPTDFDNADDSTTPGIIEFIYGGAYGQTGVSNTGTLFTLNFDTLAAGTSFLNFSDMIFINSQSDALGDIPFTAVNGALTILPVVVTPPTGDVPEPASALLLGAGAAAFIARRRRAAALTCVA
jgi:hypothetical protein